MRGHAFLVFVLFIACQEMYGTEAQYRRQCIDQPCLHDGICKDEPNGDFLYRCECQPQYSGPNCDIPLDQEETPDRRQCIDQPCLHYGTCKEEPNGDILYRCECPPQYSGLNCEISIVQEETPEDIDYSTGDELDYADDHHVDHAEDGSGDHIGVGLGTDAPLLPDIPEEAEDSYCHSMQPCRNGGTCFDEYDSFWFPTGYHCECLPEFDGPDCENEKEEVKEVMLSDDGCTRKVSIGIPQVKYMASLNCEEGTIYVKSVAYGSGAHWNAWIDQVGKMCNHHQHCEVAAKDEMLDDPYRRVYKRLIIVYECSTHMSTDMYG